MARSPVFWSILKVITITKLCLASASTLFNGATIATWNDSSQAIEVYRNVSLLVEGDEISRIYKSSESVPDSNASVIDASNKIIVPGFVSTHQHVWQPIYKTLVPNSPFASYFPRLSHLGPISLTLSEDDIYSSQLMGTLELLDQGTTSWIDITAVLSPETVEAAWRATFASGGRSFFGATVQGRYNFSAEAQIAQIHDLARSPELRNSSLVTLGLSYDGFDGAPAKNRTEIIDLVHSGAVNFITSHYLGGPFGSYNSPELLNSPEWGLLNDTWPMIFSHGSQMTARDAYLLRQTNQYLSTAPESEEHGGIGNPYSHLVADQTSLAADSVVGFSTSLVLQARLWMQTVRGRISELAADQWRIGTHTPMTVNQAFYLATRGGALALRRRDLGIIVEGAKADLVLYDGTGPDMVGWRDPVAAIILYSHAGDISDVVVGGKFVKKDFKLTCKGYNELRKDFVERAEAFTRRYNNWDFGPLPHWFYLSKYVRGQEVDVVRGEATGY